MDLKKKPGTPEGNASIHAIAGRYLEEDDGIIRGSEIPSNLG